jgi:hypothetical protein
MTAAAPAKGQGAVSSSSIRQTAPSTTHANPTRGRVSPQPEYTVYAQVADSPEDAAVDVTVALQDISATVFRAFASLKLRQAQRAHSANSTTPPGSGAEPVNRRYSRDAGVSSHS